VLIHTLAVDSKNPEVQEAQKRGIKILSYPQALGEITKGKKLIAISGTHGKTTTTGLLIAACLAAGEDISCLVGTNLPLLENTNARVGESEWFILEACEYKRAFLNLNPRVIAITNLEVEHLDYYKNFQDYENAFSEFIQKLPPNGVLVASSLEANLEKIIPAAPNFFDAKDVSDLFQLKIWGDHNRRNAKLAFVIAELMGLDSEKIHEGIENFSGAERRMELKGEFQKAKVFDDYAHHPTEIQASLRGVRDEFPDERVIVVYQQHQINRARNMLHEIGESFWDADVVVIPNIYEVRDEADSSNEDLEKELVKEIRKNGKEVIHTKSFEKSLSWLRENACENDVIIVMGAGDVFEVSRKLLE